MLSAFVIFTSVGILVGYGIGCSVTAKQINREWEKVVFEALDAQAEHFSKMLEKKLNIKEEKK